LLGEDNYVNNGLHGSSREWYQNGQLKREAEYELSILVKDKKWDEGGKLVEEFVLTENDPLFKTLQDFWEIYGKNLTK
jgi:antitoxin component YwqK of YwqJK toxin-antitoxin module